MDNNFFDDLVASIKEAGAIKRNELKASRVTELELPDIKEVRENWLNPGRVCCTFAYQCKNPTKLGTRPSLSDWSCGDFNSYSRCSSNFNLRSLDNTPQACLVIN